MTLQQIRQRPSLSALIVLSSLLLPCSPQQVKTNFEHNKHRRLQKSTGGFDAFDTDHSGGIDPVEYNNAVKFITSSLQNGVTESDSLAKAVPVNQSPRFSEDEDLQFIPAFFSSVGMIIATEIGDKTFFIAAVLSMRHDRLIVFAGSFMALIIMTILSSMMGMVLPSVMPRQYTHIIGGILFFYFGIKLLTDARSMKRGKCSDELEEVEEELSRKKKTDSEESDDDVESDNSSNKQDNGHSSPAPPVMDMEKVFIQALSLTFVAEWGDRSQIATIALAAAKNPWGVNFGAILGHSLCTGMACVGGRILAARISEKTVSAWGGSIFLVFGVHSLFFES